MRLFAGLVARIKSAVAATTVPVGSYWNVLGTIREAFTGAWQRNIAVESTENVLAFSAVYSCISLIAEDIAKLRLKLVERLANGIWEEVAGSPLAAVLKKPNRFQTRIQFISQWIVSKLLYGNTYVLKERDERGVVRALYILDARLVRPLVTPDGGVYYQLSVDLLAGVEKTVTIPASEIIHDRMLCLWHPLMGISPIYACGASATQGIRIQGHSGKFFENMSRPSGMLTAPGAISDENAIRLKAEFEKNFSGANIGRLLVGGDGLKYEPMTMPAEQAQLIEQLKWTVEDVARCFHVPPHKLGMGEPTLNNVAALNQDYYNQCIQSHLEAIELLLDEGLGLTAISGKVYGTEFDVEGLLRMDPLSLAEQNEKDIKAGTLKPNEARARRNLPPVVGGDDCYLQQQNYSLSALAKRDARPDPFATDKPAGSPPPAAASAGKSAEEIAEAEAVELIDRITKGLVCATSS